MARIYFVKRAQQRYATLPVIDEETGQQKKVPLTRNGKQLVNKSGSPRFLRLTVRDLTRPLPMPRCDYPECPDREIKPGTPYRYVDLKVGGTKYRHAEHPSWQPWDLSGAMWAQIAQLVDGAERELDGLGDFEDASDVKAVLEAAAEEARGLAEQRTEAADNMEDGFGHETEQSATLREHADNIESWADELEQWTPDEEDPPSEDDFGEQDCDTCGGSGETDCDTCNGSGEVEPADGEGDEECPDCEGSGKTDCDACDGTGKVESDESFEDAMTEWREAVLDGAREALAETPEV